MKYTSLFLIFVTSGLVLLIETSCTKKAGFNSSDIDYYTCAMHPSVHESKPGPCPICGMDLIPVKKKTATNEASSPAKNNAQPMQDMDHSQHGMSSTSETKISTATEVSPEASTIQIAPERLQSIGVRTGIVKKERLQRLLRTTGVVVVDESSVRDINIKAADGFINKLYVGVTGQKVHEGEPLASILSEGWIEAQQDYIKAFRAWRRTNVLMANNNEVALNQEFNRMRARLRVWDLTDEQLKKFEDFALKLKDTDFVLRKGLGEGLSGTFELQSPFNGIVLQKDAVEGMKFQQGQTLFRLAKLSPIWIDAEFPEDQAPFVALGHEFDIMLPALPDYHSKAKVSFIYPQVNSETRRLKARFILPNQDAKLLPGMYANVNCALEYGEKLSVPFDAVIPTGDRFVVFLDHGGGKLEPRFIKIGEKLGDSYEVIDGLNEGERVITSANFLIDSESRIQGALKSWSGSGKSGSKAPSGHEGMPGM